MASAVQRGHEQAGEGRDRRLLVEPRGSWASASQTAPSTAASAMASRVEQDELDRLAHQVSGR